MVEGFNLVRRRIDALGARWDMFGEGAFREGLRSLVERRFGFRIEEWVKHNGEGLLAWPPF
ncbi:MAG: DUF3782 domain-containing protein [Candidatus Nezhaarchaeales archaeon]